MKNIAIIPARSGSKGLKNKNIKDLCGKPLIAYSIESAIDSGVFDTVMVSTDSEKYAAIARQYGAQVPFLRSETNSSDASSSWDMVEEVLSGYHSMGIDFDTFMLLQPTSPLRTKEDIQGAYDELKNKNAKAIVSVCEVDHSPLQCNILPETLSFNGFFSEDVVGKRRQDLPIFYRLNGAIYLSDVDYFLESHNIYRKDCFAYKMDKRKSIDIDDEYDFAIAEIFMAMK